MRCGCVCFFNLLKTRTVQWVNDITVPHNTWASCCLSPCRVPLQSDNGGPHWTPYGSSTRHPPFSHPFYASRNSNKTINLILLMKILFKCQTAWIWVRRQVTWCLIQIKAICIFDLTLSLPIVTIVTMVTIGRLRVNIEDYWWPFKSNSESEDAHTILDLIWDPNCLTLKI